MPAPSYTLTALEGPAGQHWNADTAGPKKDRNPSWCVAFVRFKIPGAMFTGDADASPTSSTEIFDTKPLLVVENDCVAVTVNNPKASMAKTCSLTMKVGEIWYQNAVAPGDWVFVWMSDDQDSINKTVDALFGVPAPTSVTSKLGNKKSSGPNYLNGWNSGLKFMGRVMEVSNADAVSAGGQRTIGQNISCQAFTELASSIYYTFVAQNALTLDNTVRAAAAATSFYEKELAGLTGTTTSTVSPAASQPPTGVSNGLETALTNLSNAFLNFWRPIDGNNQLVSTSPEKIIGLMFMLTMGIDPKKVNFFDGENTNSNADNTVPGAVGAFGDAIGVPAHVSSILGRKSATKLWQLYNVYLGLQTYENLHAPQPYQRFAPTFVSINAKNGFKPQPGTANSVFYGTPYRCKGFVPFLVPPIWDNNSFWNIYNQFLNPVVNEMYTVLRCNVEGKIMPTLVVREKPFSTELFKYFLKKAPTFTITSSNSTSETKGIAQMRKNLSPDEQKAAQNIGDQYDKLQALVPELTQRTYFNNVPRWIVSESVLLSVNVAPSESRRVNFVQVWGRSAASEFIGANLSQEVLKQAQFLVPNYVSDDRDIQRHGLRADISETNYDVVSSQFGTISHILARQRADWLFNGHLKLFGTVTLQGVQLPICEGDNIQVRGILYHIEGVSHAGTMGPDGTKSFRTTITISNGIIARSLDSKQGIPAFAVGDQRYELTQSMDALNDHPGFTDIQVTGARKNRDDKGEYTKKGDSSGSGKGGGSSGTGAAG